MRDQLRRRARPVVAALALWSAWALVCLALYRSEDGLWIALLLLGFLVLLSGAYGLLWLRRDLRRERQRETQRMQQLAWLAADIRSRQPLPTWVGGMARPELLQATWNLIREERPRRVLELGSGLSTLVMAYALEASGQGEMFALEDVAPHAAATRRLLAEHGLAERARVLDAPLRQWEWDGRQLPWYSLTNLPADAAFDFLLVDGPAGYLGPSIRYPALPLLQERLAQNARILVDDTNRPDERAMVERWLAEIPGLQRDERRTNPRFAVLCYARPDTQTR